MNSPAPTAPECHDVEPDYRVKFTDVLTELKYQLATQPLSLTPPPKNKHSILYETIEDLTWRPCRGGGDVLWYELNDWYDYHRCYNIVDKTTLNRIKAVIYDSSPSFVYGEDLTYQELIAFKLYIKLDYSLKPHLWEEEEEYKDYTDYSKELEEDDGN